MCSFDDSRIFLENGTDKIRFEYCLDRNRQIQYMRSVQSHSAGLGIDPKLQNNVPFLHERTDCIYHVGSTFDYRSFSEGGVIAGGLGVREGRQACFSTAGGCHGSIEPNEPRTFQNKLRWGLTHNAVYWFYLRLAHKGKHLGKSSPVQSYSMAPCQEIAW